MSSQRPVDICFRKLEKKWEATMPVDGRKVHIGYFESKSLAKKHSKSVCSMIDKEKLVDHPWDRSDLKVARSGRVAISSLVKSPIKSSQNPFLRRHIDSDGDSSTSSSTSHSSSRDMVRLARLEASSANTQRILGKQIHFDC
jgi:hypothetical protein